MIGISASIPESQILQQQSVDEATPDPMLDFSEEDNSQYIPIATGA